MWKPMNHVSMQENSPTTELVETNSFEIQRRIHLQIRVV
jgi:hypothetical protein